MERRTEHARDGGTFIQREGKPAPGGVGQDERRATRTSYLLRSTAAEVVDGGRRCITDGDPLDEVARSVMEGVEGQIVEEAVRHDHERLTRCDLVEPTEEVLFEASENAASLLAESFLLPDAWGTGRRVQIETKGAEEAVNVRQRLGEQVAADAGVVDPEAKDVIAAGEVLHKHGINGRRRQRRLGWATVDDCALTVRRGELKAVKQHGHPTLELGKVRV
jgi:hypothetical protein